MSQPSLNYSAFVAQFPAFSSLTQSTVENAWAEALATVTSQITTLTGDPATDAMNAIRLNYATAHLLALFAGENGNAPTGIVGRVDDATQGSVHVHADMGVTSQSSAWWMQTSYGARFWQLTEPLRRFQYVAYQRPNPGVIPWRTR
jgi:hypothetical protein